MSICPAPERDCPASFVVAAYNPSTPHSSGFVRLASGAFYEAISLATFYEIIKIRSRQCAEEESYLYVREEIPLLLLNDLDVLGFRAFGCFFDLEAHPLFFLQGFKTISLNCSVMDEKVWPIILFDETKAFLLVEPLYLSFCHNDSLLLFNNSGINLNVV
jgi:hypothetical protein